MILIAAIKLWHYTAGFNLIPANDHLTLFWWLICSEYDMDGCVLLASIEVYESRMASDTFPFSS